MVRGAVTATLVALGLQGCFSASFLEDTCERLPGGCGSSSSSSSSSGGESTSSDAVPTTGGSTGDTSTGTTGMSPGLKFDGPAFRIDEMQIVDPHLFIKDFGCTDAHNFVNSGLTTSVATKETNLILLANQYDPKAPTQEFWFYRAADCPKDQDYCLLDPLAAPVVFVSFNRDDANCLEVDTSTMNPASVDELNLPSLPCVVSPQASLPIQLTPDLDPITFYQGQFAAHYEPSDEDPTVLRDAILYGFIPKSEAEVLSYNYLGTMIDLWSVIRGSDHPNACAEDMLNPSDVDMLDLDPNDMKPPEMGVYLYLNFTASKIDFYALPPP